jgi:RimJ/RimL family protein N-acetyltransferase
VEIRRATTGDALAIATVHVRSWQVAYRDLLPRSYLDGLDPERSRGPWLATLEATAWPSTGVLVLTDRPSDGASKTSTVIGFAGISPTRDTDEDPATVGELQTLYLDPAVWRRGAGSLLLEAAVQQLLEAGLGSVSAWVLETNGAARAFYEHHGWRADGTSKLHDWGSFVVTDVRYRLYPA